MKRSLSISCVLLAFGISCGPHRGTTAPSTPPEPAPVYAPSLGSVRFTTEQIVEATHDGNTHAFRAVAEKDGDHLIVVILTSFGVRAVTLTQDGEHIEVERHLPRDLPFQPEYIAADVARSLIVGLPIEPAPAPEHVLTRTFGAETFEDRFENDHLVERRVQPVAGAAAPGVEVEGEAAPVPVAGARGTVIRYEAPGMALDGTPPHRYSVRNEAFGYELVVTTQRYEKRSH